MEHVLYSRGVYIGDLHEVIKKDEQGEYPTTLFVTVTEERNCYIVWADFATDNNDVVYTEQEQLIIKSREKALETAVHRATELKRAVANLINHFKEA